MMIDADSVRLCKLYCKIDADDDEATQLLIPLMEAAIVYLQNAGIEDCGSNQPLYQLALWGLVLHWYDGGEAVGGVDKLPAGTRAIINQLKYVPEYGMEAAI